MVGAVAIQKAGTVIDGERRETVPRQIAFCAG